MDAHPVALGQGDQLLGARLAITLLDRDERRTSHADGFRGLLLGQPRGSSSHAEPLSEACRIRSLHGCALSTGWSTRTTMSTLRRVFHDNDETFDLSPYCQHCRRTGTYRVTGIQRRSCAVASPNILLFSATMLPQACLRMIVVKSTISSRHLNL